MQIQVGELFSAKRMVPVINAHFTGDPEVFGQADIDYLERITGG
ncbi:putative aconitase [Arthrobacter silviterrae]|nr:hypothetical protein [Arthrobacter silviterrae]MDQ0278884.1 putative aconitase [Arthrobacter silviterrae]